MISSIVKGNINQETLLMDPTLSQKVASDFCLQLGSWLNINFYMTHMVRGLFLMLRNPILFLVLSICFRRLISREVGQLPSSIGDYSLVTLVVTLLVGKFFHLLEESSTIFRFWLYIPRIISSVLHLPLYPEYIRVSRRYPHSPQKMSPHLFQVRHYGIFSHSYGSYGIDGP